MNSPRWRKVLADLWSNKTRTLLTMLTIAVGLFAVGFVSSMTDIMMPDMDADYWAGNPHSAIIYCEPFADELLNTLRRVDGVEAVEGRNSVMVRILTDDPHQKLNISFQGFSDKTERTIDRLRPSNPAVIPALERGDVLIEASALNTLPLLKPGYTLRVEMPNGKVRQLRVAGLVRDISIIPYHMGWNSLMAYTSPETVEWLGGPSNNNEVYLTVADHKTDEQHVKTVAQAVAKKIEKSGRTVYQNFVYHPGTHFASFITQGVAAILGILGGLSVFLSIFLIINTLNALLTQHTRQIGIMKAVGGGTGQIAGMYFTLVLAFGLLALIPTVPLSGFISYKVVESMSSWMNFQPGGFRIPPETVALQTALALGVPMLAAIIPVLTSTRITVRQAISNYGIAGGGGKPTDKPGLIARCFSAIFSRPLLISLHNTVRRKARLTMTLITLTLGGATFIAVLNLHTAIGITLDDAAGYFLSDVNVNFGQGYRLEKIQSIVANVPGIAGMESWGYSGGQVMAPDGETGVDVGIMAPPSNSQLIDPIITAGRWLVPEDQNAVVIGNHLLKLRPDLKVGDSIVIKIRDEDTPWRIVGFYQMVGNVSPPLLYTNKEYLAPLTGQTAMTYNVRVITADHSPIAQKQIATALDQAFQLAGIKVSGLQTGAEWQLSQTSTMDVLVYFMLAMAVMIAVVGGLGLMGTMSMNVLERTREIGVMRAIGASNGAILQLVLVEGILIGVISWGLSVAFSVPITSALNSGVGSAILSAPMNFAFGWDGLAFWLLAVLLISALASALPAWNAVRLTVRDVLAYE